MENKVFCGYDAGMKLEFIKMHGLGNDFVMIDARATNLRLSPDQARFLADRRRGVGCDQVIVIEPSMEPGADLFMRIFNPDGSEAEGCGNATRCVAARIFKEKGVGKCVIRTLGGFLHCTSQGNGGVQVDMGVPGLEWNEIPLSKQCDTLHLPLDGDPVGVSMGNPHCVYFCEDAEVVAVDKIGPKSERHPLFPERTNVEYVSILDPTTIRMRVWERGAGVTQACGTGACAAAVAAMGRGLVEGRCVKVVLDGGALNIEWRAEDGHVLMTGPATYVFSGQIEVPE